MLVKRYRPRGLLYQHRELSKLEQVFQNMKRLDFAGWDDKSEDMLVKLRAQVEAIENRILEGFHEHQTRQIRGSDTGPSGSSNG